MSLVSVTYCDCKQKPQRTGKMLNVMKDTSKVPFLVW